MHSDRYWNDRYQKNETGWDIGYANPAIVDYFKNIDKQSKILIPGCGNGYEGEHLHNIGFEDLTLTDFAPNAKSNFLQRTPSFNAEQFLIEDFFKLEDQYDFIIEQTFFCALTPNMRESYVSKMSSLLKPSGKLVGVLFDAPLNTEHPPYGGSKEEYITLFSKQFQTINLKPCELSIPPRQGKELWIEISL